MDAIAEEFGRDFVAPDGALDRARMRAVAFEAPTAKRRLEAILHPLIRVATEAEATMIRPQPSSTATARQSVPSRP